MGLLSLAIWTPIAFGALLLAFGSDKHAGAVRWLALIGALIGFAVTLPLYEGFKLGTAAMQFVEKAVWIEGFNIHYHLGVDGISFWFVPLTAFITVIVVIASWESITERVYQYMGAFLILSGLMIGVFASLDGMLFYVFFEATLIPMYLIIGIWGGPNKIYAAFKFFLYTLLGSLLMLVALIYLYNQSSGSFDIATWHQLPLSRTAQTLLFFAFFAAFAVEINQPHTMHRRLFVDFDRRPGLVEVARTLKQPHRAARCCVGRLPICAQDQFDFAVTVYVERLHAHRQFGKSGDDGAPRPRRIFVPHNLIGIFGDHDDVGFSVAIDIGHGYGVTDADVGINDLFPESWQVGLGNAGGRK